MLRKITPCDVDGICPYGAEYGYTCEYCCGEDPEPEDYYEYDEMDYDPYAGQYLFDE